MLILCYNILKQNKKKDLVKIKIFYQLPSLLTINTSFSNLCFLKLFLKFNNSKPSFFSQVYLQNAHLFLSLLMLQYIWSSQEIDIYYFFIMLVQYINLIYHFHISI